jgi:hypothetical protein
MKRTRILFLLLLVLFVLAPPSAPALGNAEDACQVLRATCQDPVSFTCDRDRQVAICETFSPSSNFANACAQLGGYYNVTCPIIDLWPCIETCGGFTN